MTALPGFNPARAACPPPVHPPADPQIPGGWAAQLYGGRVCLIICFVSWSTVSILTPTSAGNTLAIIMARVLVGVSQGFLIPAVHTVLSQVRHAGLT